MCSPLLLLQCPACLVRLILRGLGTGGRWPYSCCFAGFCFQDLVNIARDIFAQLPSSFFSLSLVSVHVLHPHSCMERSLPGKDSVF